MATTTQPAMTRLNANEAWCEALFASALQPGDHPDAAASRMRWVRQFAQTTGGGR